jgi:N-methylhydantoinase A
LITTKGFRDVLELGRFRSPRLYDLDFRKPKPLVERDLRFEVNERTDGKGDILRSVDGAELDAVARRLVDKDVDAVAICLINSYINPANEQAATASLRDILPKRIAISASHRILPQIQ